MAIHLTDQNFDEEVLGGDKPVLVDFWAPWCGPCQMMSPIIDALSEEVTTAKFCKLDVDQNPEKASEYGIMSIPSLKIFKGGEIVKEMIGVQSKDAIKDALASV